MRPALPELLARPVQVVAAQPLRSGLAQRRARPAELLAGTVELSPQLGQGFEIDGEPTRGRLGVPATTCSTAVPQD